MADGFIWNQNDIDHWLDDLAGGDLRVRRLFHMILRPALLRHDKALVLLEGELPEGVRGRFKNASGPYFTFERDRDPRLSLKVSHIADWIKAMAVHQQAGRLRYAGATIDMLNGYADEEMVRASAMLSQTFNAGTAETDDDIETVMTFENGYKIVRMKSTNALKRESAIMQHCIGEGAYDKKLGEDNHFYYSLRSPENLPHATMEAFLSNGRVFLIQCTGKQNEPATLDYFPYIDRFITEHNMLIIDAHLEGSGVVERGGKNYSVYALPEEFELDKGLDLSLVKSDLVLPQKMNINGTLILNGKNPPCVSPDVWVKELEYQVRHRGRLHDTDRPAYIKFDPVTRAVERLAWYSNGEVHRDDGPALMGAHMKEGMKVSYEFWMRNGDQYNPSKAERTAWVVKSKGVSLIDRLKMWDAPAP